MKDLSIGRIYKVIWGKTPSFPSEFAEKRNFSQIFLILITFEYILLLYLTFIKKHTILVIPACPESVGIYYNKPIPDASVVQRTCQNDGDSDFL